MARNRQARIKNYFAENRLFAVRSIVAGVIAAVLLLTVAGRLFYLQVLRHDYYATLSQGNRIRTEPIPPSRGLILDRHGVVLAVNRYQFSGVDIHTRLARHYPFGELAVHAIGYVSAINEQDMKQIDVDEYAGTSLIGKLGVEAAYEKELHGKRGSREILVNAAGRPVEKQGEYAPKLAVHSPVAGDDLILGLDVNVQKVAEEALA